MGSRRDTRINHNADVHFEIRIANNESMPTQLNLSLEIHFINWYFNFISNQVSITQNLKCLYESGYLLRKLYTQLEVQVINRYFVQLPDNIVN